MSSMPLQSLPIKNDALPSSNRSSEVLNACFSSTVELLSSSFKLLNITLEFFHLPLKILESSLDPSFDFPNVSYKPIEFST